MKQFNLQEYLEHPERKVVTRDGRDVRIICTDRKGAFDKPIVALVYDKEEEWEECPTYGTDGKCNSTRESCLDLFFAPTKHEGWINVYSNDGDYYTSCGVYDTKEDAEMMKSDDEDYLTTIKIEWEE